MKLSQRDRCGRGAGLILMLIILVSWPLSAADRPNIIIIMSDDMGFSDIGCYGSEISTPNLDSLAAQGLRFTQFYNTARCCPTRASLLTGLYPHQAGIGHMTSDRHLIGYQGGLNRECVTIAEVLRPAGYRTYMVGKWHVCRETSPEGPKYNWPLQRGFEKFYGTITGAGSFFDPTRLCRQNTFITPVNDPEYQPETFYYTDAISDNAVRYVKDHHQESADKPFFMYVAYTAAHWPMHALPDDIARYEGRYDQGYQPIRQARFQRLRDMGLIDPDWDLTPRAEDWGMDEDYNRWEARNMEVYAAMIDNMDRGIGRIVDALKQIDQFDNTLIFFLQDNGGCAEGMGRKDNEKWHLEGIEPMAPDELQPNIWPPMRTRDGRPVLGGSGVMAGPADTYIAYGRGWANVSNTPFREYKHWVHEGGISTPLIAHWPAKIKRRGQLEHQPGHLIDLMATCVELAGAAYPKEKNDQPIQPLEGLSLVPTFTGGVLDRDAIYWEHEGNRALRQGKWKLVAKGADGEWELYDMEKDRTEVHNLAGDHPDITRRLVEKWEAWARRARVLPWPYGGKYAPPIRKKFVFDTNPASVTLKDHAAPQIDSRAFVLEGRFTYNGSDGVIVVQGGGHLGYAVYVMQNRLHFGIRNQGVFTRVSSHKPLPKGEVEFKAALNKGGILVLTANGLDTNSADAGGLIARLPADPFEIGRDSKGLVGDYPRQNTYPDKIHLIALEILDE